MDIDNRINILNRMKAKSMSIEEFDYDKLQAPPLEALFTAQDIQQLHYITTSLKLSAKPKIKYQMIDEIMRFRGFEKLAAGTNRVVYRFLEDQSFVVKVAYDAIGIGDNPAEFRNQFLIKPFCCKCFEVSLDGVLGIFERVQPITNREEFVSVADDIFTLIDEWLVNGDYVLADIGSKFFMNYGIRTSFPFGPVIIDYPYIYKLDGNKLFCNKPDPNSPTGRCEGEIDYDDGFNFLRCKKCGATYKAEELRKAIDDGAIIKPMKGRKYNMKVRITGGSMNLNKVVTVDESKEEKATPTKPVIKARFTTNVNDERNTIPVQHLIDNNKKKENKQKLKKVKYDYKEPEKKIKIEENKEVEVRNPFTKDEKLEEKSREELFDEYLDKIISIVKSFPDDSDERNTMLDKIDKAYNDLDTKEESEFDQFKNVTDRMIDIIDNMENPKDFEKSLNYDKLLDFFNNYYEIRLKDNDGSVNIIEDEGSNQIKQISIGVIPIIGVKYDSEEETRVEHLTPEVHLLIDKENSVGIIDYFNKRLIAIANTNGTIYGYKKFSGTISNVKDLFPDAHSEKVLIPIDETGHYLTIDNKIIAINKIDDRNVSAISIVSSEWLNALKDDNSNDEDIDYDEIPEEEVSDEKIEESVKEAPTGALPPMGVNGVVAEEE